MNCPNCGEAAAADAIFCVRCGTQLPAGCPNCGEVNSDGSRFCRACGMGLVGATAATPPRPATVACPRCQASNTQDADFCYSCGLPFDEPGQRPGGQTIVAGGTPSGFWIRLVAWFIDSIALVAAELAIVVVLPGLSFDRYLDESEFTWTYNFISLLVGIAYYSLGVSLFSTTIGKRLLGMYVLRRDGSKISLPRAFCRYLAYIPSYLILCIGFLMIGLTRNKRGLHDHICDTVVVKR